MATQLQIRRGTAAQVAAFTGAEGEIVYNSTTDSIHTNDGATVGGFELARVDGSNWNISNNVAFTTISASGEIAANGGIALGDNDKATFGAGDDLQIYHDGSNSRIDDVGTGDLVIKASAGIELKSNGTNKTAAYFVGDGAASLYHNGLFKFSTTATGIDVTGTATMDGLTSSGIIEASDGTNGEMQLGLGTALTTGAGTYDSSVRWNGSAGNLLFSQGAVEKMRITATGIDVTGTATMGGLEVEGATTTIGSAAASTNVQLNINGVASKATRIQFQEGGTNRWLLGQGAASETSAFELYNSVGVIALSVDRTSNIATFQRGAVFNEGSADSDFRVESDANTHALFVDAGTSRVGINKAAPNRALDVHSGSASDITTFGNDAGSYTFGKTANLGSLDLAADASFRIRHGSTESVRFGPSATIFNEGSADVDFRVESDGNSHMLFVDAGNDRVSVGGISGQAVKFGILNGSLTSACLSVECTHTTAYGAVKFNNGNGEVGSISVYATSVGYNTTSDERLKENIADADDAGSKIDAIQVRKYDWKADGSHQDYGMIAQELQAVAPEAVSVPEDPDEMMGVDYSKLVPMLIKEIQSLRNRVAQLEE